MPICPFALGKWKRFIEINPAGDKDKIKGYTSLYNKQHKSQWKKGLRVLETILDSNLQEEKKTTYSA
jgi:hypothetical protein